MKRFLIALVFAVALFPSFGCPGTVPVVTNAVIDCTVENQDQIASLIGEFKGLLNGQAPDWKAIYNRAKQAGKSIGGCALAELVQDYLGNKAAPPPQADSWNAYTTLENFRRAEAANATFRTTIGDL